MSTYIPQNFATLLPRAGHIQNETFFIQEFYNTFIEKVISEFDVNGEINLYWLQLKQKISEEKNFQQLYKYILNLEIKKREQSKLDLLDISKQNIDSIPSTQAISQQKIPNNEEMYFNGIKKTPTNVRTVSIQFEVLSKMNSNNSNGNPQKDECLRETASHLNSPKMYTQKLPSLTILKNISFTNQKTCIDSPYGNFSPQSVNQSFSNHNSPLGGGKNCFKILENIRKRNSSPNYSHFMCQSPLFYKQISQTQESSIKTCGSQKQFAQTITDITFDKNQKEFEKSLQNISYYNNNKKEQKQKNQLKRFTPQQIIRMNSIREAEDEVTENNKDSLQKQSVQKLLEQVISAKNVFKLDSETLNLIHGKSSLALAQNCKNSMGHEQFKAHIQINDNSVIDKQILKKSIHNQSKNELNLDTANKNLNNNTFLLSPSPKKQKNKTPVRDKYFPK